MNGIGIAFIFIAGGICLLLHLALMIVFYFSGVSKLLLYTAIASGSCSMFLLATVGKHSRDHKQGLSNVAEESQKESDYLNGIGVTTALGHLPLIKAIAADDTAMLETLISQNVRACEEDLDYAFTLSFTYYEKKDLSPALFKILLRNTAMPDSEKKIAQILRMPEYALSINRLEVIDLLLTGSGNDIPFKMFPVTCLPVLKLLVKHNVDINMITLVDFSFYFGKPESAKVDVKWSPVMIYLHHYPQYVDELKFLLEQHPDLSYADENGFTFKDLLRETLKAYGDTALDLKNLQETYGI
jgi:hypothetical protein